jgi:hypothetical protein
VKQTPSKNEHLHSFSRVGVVADSNCLENEHVARFQGRRVAAAAQSNHPRKRVYTLIFKVVWWCWWQIATALENEHVTCFQERPVAAKHPNNL